MAQVKRLAELPTPVPMAELKVGGGTILCGIAHIGYKPQGITYIRAEEQARTEL